MAPSRRRSDERARRASASGVRPHLARQARVRLRSIGAVVVFVFFAVQSRVFRSPSGIANWLDPASTYGIMAVAVALLMIGGHFDLSAGVQLGHGRPGHRRS